MNPRLVARAGVFALTLLAILVSSVAASKPGPGGSTGTGRVFFPNPVASLGDQSLTDQKDADYAALQPAYRVVTLTNLDREHCHRPGDCFAKSARNDPG